MLFRNGLCLCFWAADSCPADGLKFSVVENIRSKLVIGQNFVIVSVGAEKVNLHMDAVLDVLLRPAVPTQGQTLLRGFENLYPFTENFEKAKKKARKNLRSD